ncbi:MAG: alpha-glucosidase C-terminal domain-containing protein [Chitinophagaceae bacterium]|nr:alpha-glucosidase C-terminal domain-containing protein [Chitinophagaceae bacterium]MCW5929765.1 alpha-glucosidase C-terminal domain-containing protein [Chitinophagaceae bacterium]
MIKDEIIYHIFLRSFFDSNGDTHGDLTGVKEKLDYLRDLGVTSIMLTPVYKSVFYHNYFADDFEGIDPLYGSRIDYIELVKAVHQKGMKIYMDMEIQYVTEDHAWFKASYGNPSSPYSEYIVYKDEENHLPETVIFNLSGLHGYNNTYRRVTTVNLLSRRVQDYMYSLFAYWIDPLGNGSFEYGIDGFRLDHMMDTLDEKPHLSQLFTGFWRPLIKRLKKINPTVVFLGEQTDWDSYGADHIQQAGVDKVFAFRLREAFISFSKDKIAEAVDAAFHKDIDQNRQMVFIENHDVHRFATVVNSNPDALRIGAALNLLTGGVPVIYYGQEIGMKGDGGFGKYGNSDGNDIPRREAMRWHATVEGRGMALWYKNTGPWWNDSSLHDHDGISVEEQQLEASSLWSFYRKLILLRTKYRALISGSHIILPNNSSAVYSFMRRSENERIVILINFSDKSENVQVELDLSKMSRQGKKLIPLIGKIPVRVYASGLKVTMPEQKVGVWEIRYDNNNY